MYQFPRRDAGSSTKTGTYIGSRCNTFFWLADYSISVRVPHHGEKPNLYHTRLYIHGRHSSANYTFISSRNDLTRKTFDGRRASHTGALFLPHHQFSRQKHLLIFQDSSPHFHFPRVTTSRALFDASQIFTTKSINSVMPSSIIIALISIMPLLPQLTSLLGLLTKFKWMVTAISLPPILIYFYHVIAILTMASYVGLAGRENRTRR